MNITFELLDISHFPLMLRWLETPHVKEWWDQDIVYTLDLVNEKFDKYLHGNSISNTLSKDVYAYIIIFREEKIGYIQAYNAIAYAQENGFNPYYISDSVGGVDLFIGEASYLGKGIGPSILNEFADQILSKYFKYCLLDPSTNNRRAIKASEKAGFKVDKQCKTENKTWMVKELSSIRVIL